MKNPILTFFLISYFILSALILEARAFEIKISEDAQFADGEYVVQFKSHFQIERYLKQKRLSTHTARERSILGFGILKLVIPDFNMIVIQRPSGENPNKVIESLSKDSRVDFVEPNYIYHSTKAPNDPDFKRQWGLLNHEVLDIDLGMDKAWDQQTGSSNLVVGVVDTGIDFNHPNLKENIWTNEAEFNGQAGVDDDQNGYIDDIHGFNFLNNTGESLDDNNHGTHCAGIIGAKGNDGIGTVGVNWNVKLMSLKFLDKEGGGKEANAANAIAYAIKMKVPILNNSWGGTTYSKVLDKAIEKAKEAGILFIVAAGNDGGNNDERPYYPATYSHDNIISVTAMTYRGNLSVFANFGVNSVHVMAPGESIFSTIIGGYDFLSGTSMAAPHVAGLAALLWSQFPTMNYQDIRERILKTSVPLEGANGKIQYGLINGYKALNNVISPPIRSGPEYWENLPAVFATAHPYANNSNQEWEINVPQAKEIAIHFRRLSIPDKKDRLQVRTMAEDLLLDSFSSETNKENFYTKVYNTNSVKIHFSSNWMSNGYGFEIDRVAWR